MTKIIHVRDWQTRGTIVLQQHDTDQRISMGGDSHIDLAAGCVLATGAGFPQTFADMTVAATWAIGMVKP